MASSDITIRIKVVGVKRAVRTLLRLTLALLIMEFCHEPLCVRLVRVPHVWHKARRYARNVAGIGRIESMAWAAWTVARLIRGGA